jgi:histidine triad (HIT) family protein
MTGNEDCLFCKMVSGAIQAKKVYEDADVLAFHDINPRAPVHVLVIPKKHFSTINDFTDADATLIGKLILAAKKVAAELGIADSGYRLIANTNAGGGQVIWHVHLHVLGGRQMTWPPG